MSRVAALRALIAPREKSQPRNVELLERYREALQRAWRVLDALRAENQRLKTELARRSRT